MKLGSVNVELDGATYSLQSIPSSVILHLPESITLTDDIDWYCAVISRQQQLVRCGEYIKLCSEVCTT